MRALFRLASLLISLPFLLFCHYSLANEQPDSTNAEESTQLTQQQTKKSSPWLITPTVSSDPKLSTTVGGLFGYIHHFDDKSPASMLAATGGYSTSDSYYYGIFGKAYFGEDKHRLSGGAFQGKIKNDYDDYLGTGLPVKTEDDMSAYVLRYQYEIIDHLYLGIQGISSEYIISPGDILSGKILNYLGLTGFQSNGLGLVVNYDQRNDQNTPTQGTRVQAHNIAYRKSFGGDESFDVYTLSAQHYISHNQRFVTAINGKGRWTVGATPAAYSSIELRGYIRGQYLSPHMTMLEIEERINIHKKWGATVFTGAAFLYGDEGRDNNTGNEDIYPMIGAGITYQLNDEKMVVRAEAAFGIDDNQGFYLQFGQPF